MVSEAGEISIETKQKHGAEQTYLRILGTGQLPASPETMPNNEIFIPPEYLGDFGEAMDLTTWNGKERFQDISIKNGLPIKGPLMVGTEYDSGGKGIPTNIARWLHLAPKALIDFHTHPRNYVYFSRPDVIRSKSFPQIAYMFMVGATSRITGLFQTEQARKGSFATYEARKIEAQLKELNWPKLEPKDFFDVKRFYNDEFRPEETSRLAKIAEKLGFAYFQWESPSGYAWSNELKDGITMKRIR